MRGYAAVRAGSLLPASTLSLTKSGSNPTFSFTGISSGPIPENIVKVGTTYYAPYGAISTTEIGLASASSPAGPWTDLGVILTGGTQTWEYDGLSAPFILQDAGTFYLYCSSKRNSDNAGAIGVATASSITGPYTKYASNPVLSPSVSGWDSVLVGEPTIVKVAGLYYIGFTGWDISADAAEKVGFASGTSPLGPFTKAAGNPLLDWGASGSWDDAVTADTHLFYENGYWWCWYTGGKAPTARPWQAGLAYSSTPLSSWTKHPANPLLTVGVSGFDAHDSWRGCVFPENGTHYVIYGGINAAQTQVRGGNAILNVSP